MEGSTAQHDTRRTCAEHSARPPPSPSSIQCLHQPVRLPGLSAAHSIAGRCVSELGDCTVST